MPMNTVLRQKRRALGLTQEQVADYLGVTTPAVNKWERGVTCPDLALLPALARLLKTDPNTLLCFDRSLSQQEIGHFMNRLTEIFTAEGFGASFAAALEKTQEYPNCPPLLHNTALVLEGELLTAVLSPEEKEDYRARITQMYRQVAEGKDEPLANRARYMLASRLIGEKRYGEAQTMLDLLPHWDGLDKRPLQADLWARQNRTAEAAALLEHKLLGTLQETQMSLAKLVPLLVELGEDKAAEALADAAQATSKAFGLWPYGAYLVPMQLAVARQDTEKTLEALSAMLREVLTPWNAAACPLYGHIPLKAGGVDLARMLPALLSDLEQNSDYDFLRGEPEFARLTAHYRGLCENTPDPAKKSAPCTNAAGENARGPHAAR